MDELHHLNHPPGCSYLVSAVVCHDGDSDNDNSSNSQRQHDSNSQNEVNTDGGDDKQVNLLPPVPSRQRWWVMYIPKFMNQGPLQSMVSDGFATGPCPTME